MPRGFIGNKNIWKVPAHTCKKKNTYNISFFWITTLNLDLDLVRHQAID